MAPYWPAGTPKERSAFELAEREKEKLPPLAAVLAMRCQPVE
jgi:hypothetical protein